MNPDNQAKIFAFIDRIDARFPYHDRVLANALIDEACSLGAEAAYMVAYELAYPPRGAGVRRARRLALLARLDAVLSDPLKDIVLDAARRLVRKEPLTLEACIAAMGVVAAHPHSNYNALNIIDLCCEDADIDAVSGHWETITRVWRQHDDATDDGPAPHPASCDGCGEMA